MDISAFVDSLLANRDLDKALKGLGLKDRRELAVILEKALRAKIEGNAWNEWIYQAHEPVNANHYLDISEAIKEGAVAFFLGAGVNLVRASSRPPSARELGEIIAKPHIPPATLDLARIAQTVELKLGETRLYGRLRTEFSKPYPPNDVHQFLANLKDLVKVCPLVFTTNYDSLLEDAFKEKKVKYDLLVYSDLKRMFLHALPSGEYVPLSDPLKTFPVNLKERALVVKVHGGNHRRVLPGQPGAEPDDPLPRSDSECFVISEDDYLASVDLGLTLPVEVQREWQKRSTLFMGYSLTDWTVRVMLRRMWEELTRGTKSWAVQLVPEPFDTMFWREKHVELLQVDAAECARELEKRLRGQ